ncbi:MAG TPA: DUF2938 domain-containing protein [Alcanivorax sp.]|nr:DUF2938 domain-containing protein [Alcanivorax sp.]
MTLFALSCFIGVGATAIMDLWGLLRKLLFGAKAPDYRLVGRWIGHMPQGRFRHDAIAAAPAKRGERLIGWAAHYATGIAFAGLLVALFGAEWTTRPTPGPALAVGIGTVVAPFFLMQPALGAGIAASRAPNPTAARLQSLITHAVFGAGLYVSARAAQWLL